MIKSVLSIDEIERGGTFFWPVTVTEAFVAFTYAGVSVNISVKPAI
jgi:hypothetical protein